MNGWLYDRLTSGAERAFLGRVRGGLVGALSGDIVELGAGTGVNFQYYSRAARVRAIEPSDSMLAEARKRAQTSSAQIELIHGDDTVLDTLPARSVDAVVATLVLCSVDDPLATVRRIKRILKAGGTFVTMEHVRDRSAWVRLQSLVTPIWRRIAGNCHLDRDLERTFRDAGFSTVSFEEQRLPAPLFRLVVGSMLSNDG
jgi:ubiquinone/menaquinone biosynthesis C-methylase UbiE